MPSTKDKRMRKKRMDATKGAAGPGKDNKKNGEAAGKSTVPPKKGGEGASARKEKAREPAPAAQESVEGLKTPVQVSKGAKSHQKVQSNLTSQAIDTGPMTSVQLADWVQATDDPDNAAFNKIKDDPRLRPVELRPGLEFDSTCPRNITAAMVYMTGSESSIPCGRCSGGFGPFVKCVVGSTSGICAGCYYGLKNKNRKCKFGPGVPSIETQKRSGDQDAAKIEAKTDIARDTSKETELTQAKPQSSVSGNKILAIQDTAGHKRKANVFDVTHESQRPSKKLKAHASKDKSFDLIGKLGRHIRKVIELKKGLEDIDSDSELNRRLVFKQVRKLAKRIDKMEVTFEKIEKIGKLGKLEALLHDEKHDAGSDGEAA